MARVQVLVKSGRGDSAAALARAVPSLDVSAARRCATRLASELAADQPARARAACEAIGRLGPVLEPDVVTALVAALKRDDVAAQYAARAIARSSTVEAGALAGLIAGIKSPDARSSVACSQSLRALVICSGADGKLRDQVADLLPAPDVDTPRLPQFGLARVAEQLGPAGRDYLIALGGVYGDEEAIVAALTFSFPNDQKAVEYVTEAVEAADGVPRKKLEAVLSRARETMGGDLPKLRVSEARRY
jgi:hypothetical protein